MDTEALVRAIAGEVLRQLQTPRIRVLVLEERSAAVARMVGERLGQDAEIVFRGEEGGASFDRHILPSLSCGDMADLAVGRASGRLSEVLQLLLRGVPVEVLEFEYHAFRATAPGALFGLYASHEKQLAAYGLTLLGPKRPDSIRIRDMLVTEQTVLHALDQGAATLVVPKKAVVTPLAAETAVNVHLNILKQE
jgi:hypothetical protein